MALRFAFLRAINLGSTRVFPKDAIQRCAREAGFDAPATHLNTGNLRFETRMRSRERIEETLETSFARDRGFDVPTIVLTRDELTQVAKEGAELAAQVPAVARHYVYLMKHDLDAELAARVEATSSDLGHMRVRGRAAHAILFPGYQAGRVDPLGATTLLGVATNRTLGVLTTLTEKWC